ncbi:MAG TPA: hypothetical protein DIW81_15235 [Planctomycetaceae bacterium]|nr:hypothetical protein [Rubinisphaera sp.]HCS52923.1 hypothetical protein [Planctomycetaceae bacterium]
MQIPNASNSYPFKGTNALESTEHPKVHPQFVNNFQMEFLQIRNYAEFVVYAYLMPTQIGFRGLLVATTILCR